MQQIPGLDSLESLLVKFKHSRAYIIPMTDNAGRALGNNGDDLMHTVFHRILDDFEIAREENPLNADVLIVPPNGALLEMYSFPQLLAEKIGHLKNTPLVIFPSSAYFPNQDPSFIFEGRIAPTLWILRERNSFNHLLSVWGKSLNEKGVELALDHDVVASGHKFVPAIIGDISIGRPLVSARLDKESAPVASVSTAQRPASRITTLQKSMAARLPYGSLYTALARWARKGALDRAGKNLLGSLEPTDAVRHQMRTARFVDASSPEYATFDEYTRMIASASIVVTDRLHVGLPAAIVGKDVVLVEAGYHKLGGVYEQSLTALPNVTFVQRQ